MKEPRRCKTMCTVGMLNNAANALCDNGQNVAQLGQYVFIQG